MALLKCPREPGGSEDGGREGAGPALPLLGHLVQSRERLQEAASGWQMLAKVKQQQLTGVEQSWSLWSSPTPLPPLPSS